MESVAIDYGLLKQALREALSEEGLVGTPALAQRFKGGALVIKPSDPALQPKEVPLEEFFRKIVRVRDQLRILEQKLNSLEKIDVEERRTLQGYVTRCYGTLTTFNVLFQDKGDHFVGQKGVK